MQYRNITFTREAKRAIENLPDDTRGEIASQLCSIAAAKIAAHRQHNGRAGKHFQAQCNRNARALLPGVADVFRFADNRAEAE